MEANGCAEPRPRVPSTPERENHFSGAITAGTDILVDTQHVRDLAPLAAPCAKRQAAGGAVTDDDDPARVAEQPNQQGAATATMAGPAPRIAVEPGAQQACHTDWFSQSACRRPSVMRRAVPSGIADASRLVRGLPAHIDDRAKGGVGALRDRVTPTASRAGPGIADGSVLAFGSHARRKNRPDLPAFVAPSALTRTSEWSSTLGAMRAPLRRWPSAPATRSPATASSYADNAGPSSRGTLSRCRRWYIGGRREPSADRVVRHARA